MKKAVKTSETSVSFCQTTRCNIPEHSRIRTCHHENLESRLILHLTLVLAMNVHLHVRGMYIKYSHKCEWI
jgi:hypothetical protein